MAARLTAFHDVMTGLFPISAPKRPYPLYLSDTLLHTLLYTQYILYIIYVYIVIYVILLGKFR